MFTFKTKKKGKKDDAQRGGGKDAVRPPVDSGRADDRDGAGKGTVRRRSSGKMPRAHGKAAGITTKEVKKKATSSSTIEVAEREETEAAEVKPVVHKKRPQTMRDAELEGDEAEEFDDGTHVLGAEKRNPKIKGAGKEAGGSTKEGKGKETGEEDRKGKKGEGDEEPTPPRPLAENEGLVNHHVDTPDSTLSLTMEQRKSPVRSVLSDMNVDIQRERKKLKVLPGYVCDNCTIGEDNCPEYRAGYVCAFQGALSAFPSRDTVSVLNLMAEVLETNKVRWRFGLLSERLVNSGTPTPDMTRLSEVVMSQSKQLLELDQEVNKVQVKIETGRQVPVQESTQIQGGILSRLFGSPVPQPPVFQPETITVSALPGAQNPSMTTGVSHTEGPSGALVPSPGGEGVEVERAVYDGGDSEKGRGMTEEEMREVQEQVAKEG